MLDGLFNIRLFDIVDSTQEVARRLYDEHDLSDMDVIIARRQSAGRGRLGRKWFAEYGGLYMTIAMRLSVAKEIWSQFSYVAGISVCEAITQSCPSCKPTLKWVNDVLIQDQKVAGILLETLAEDFLLVGIGVNIHNIVDTEDSASAASLVQFCQNIDKQDFLQKLLLRLKKNYDVWLENGFIPIRSVWLHLAQGIGRTVQVTLGDVVHRGIFIGIDEEGRIRLLNKDGSMLYIAAGDMYF
jgi:BirA family biotin operon repressor/biotin-[acetyl-CoA-carboxylase] ligase